MMRIPGLLRRCLLVGSCLAFAACASSGAGGMDESEPAGDGITIEVNNDLVPPASITVFIVPETGSRRRLGSVAPGGRESFNYTPMAVGLDHRLVAEVGGGSDAQTNPFILGSAVTRVQWNVSDPNARVFR